LERVDDRIHQTQLQFERRWGEPKRTAAWSYTREARAIIAHALRAPGEGETHSGECTCEYHRGITIDDRCADCGRPIGDTVRIDPEKVRQAMKEGKGLSVDDPGSVWA